MNYNFRKFKKNAKGLSPVIASIILIAVTVAVSVVVAAWLSGMAFGFMNNAEQATITDARFAASGATMTVSIHNTGSSAVTLKAAYIDSVQTDSFVVANGTIAKGETKDFTITPVTAPIAGASYTLKMTTAKGTSLTYNVAYNP